MRLSKTEHAEIMAVMRRISECDIEAWYRHTDEYEAAVRALGYKVRGGEIINAKPVGKRLTLRHYVFAQAVFCIGVGCYAAADGNSSVAVFCAIGAAAGLIYLIVTSGLGMA